MAMVQMISTHKQYGGYPELVGQADTGRFILHDRAAVCRWLPPTDSLISEHLQRHYIPGRRVIHLQISIQSFEFDVEHDLNLIRYTFSSIVSDTGTNRCQLYAHSSNGIVWFAKQTLITVDGFDAHDSSAAKAERVGPYSSQSKADRSWTLQNTSGVELSVATITTGAGWFAYAGARVCSTFHFHHYRASSITLGRS